MKKVTTARVFFLGATMVVAAFALTPVTAQTLVTPAAAERLPVRRVVLYKGGVGYFEGDRFRYAGKVGTGFTRAMLRELTQRLAPLVRETSPFEPEKGIPRAATWVDPEVVGQVAFMEWTSDGRLRHPSFLGVRFDKPAREVMREEP